MVCCADPHQAAPTGAPHTHVQLHSAGAEHPCQTTAPHNRGSADAVSTPRAHTLLRQWRSCQGRSTPSSAKVTARLLQDPSGGLTSPPAHHMAHRVTRCLLGHAREMRSRPQATCGSMQTSSTRPQLNMFLVAQLMHARGGCRTRTCCTTNQAHSLWAAADGRLRSPQQHPASGGQDHP